MNDREGASETERIRIVYARRAQSMEPGRYSLTRPGNRLAAEERGRILLAGLRARAMKIGELDILEVGCGAGGELIQLVGLGADPARLRGIELRPDAAEAARAQVPSVQVDVGNATTLRYADASFDLVYQSTALSSMPTRMMRAQVAAGMVRVARPGGVVVSYDFAWNPRNRDTVGIDERELRRLFPGMPMEIHRVTLAPPLGRWLGDRSVRLLRAAAALAVLRTHRLAIVDIRA